MLRTTPPTRRWREDNNNRLVAPAPCAILLMIAGRSPSRRVSAAAERARSIPSARRPRPNRSVSQRLGGAGQHAAGARCERVLFEQGSAPEQPTRASSPRGTESLRTLRWREMDSNFRFLVVRPSNRHGRRTAVSKTGADLLGNRRFESISLQRRVSNKLYRRWASMEPGRDSRPPLERAPPP
jgi:hypothetical protein